MTVVTSGLPWGRRRAALCLFVVGRPVLCSLSGCGRTCYALLLYTLLVVGSPLLSSTGLCAAWLSSMWCVFLRTCVKCCMLVIPTVVQWTAVIPRDILTTGWYVAVSSDHVDVGVFLWSPYRRASWIRKVSTPFRNRTSETSDFARSDKWDIRQVRYSISRHSIWRDWTSQTSNAK